MCLLLCNLDAIVEAIKNQPSLHFVSSKRFAIAIPLVDVQEQ